MDNKLTVSQQLKPLLLSTHWDLMEDYLADQKDRLVSQLCNCNETDLKHIQGQLKTIDKMLGLKSNMKAEMRSTR